MNQADIRDTLRKQPRTAFMLTLVGEAAGESFQARMGVACCIRNRVNADLHHDNKPDWWGEGYEGVCLQKDQFSCWWEPTAKNTIRLYGLAQQILEGTPLALADLALTSTLYTIVDDVMLGNAADTTNGANHYVTHAMLATAPPFWAKPRPGKPAPKPCTHLGSHAFFCLED